MASAADFPVIIERDAERLLNLRHRSADAQGQAVHGRFFHFQAVRLKVVEHRGVIVRAGAKFLTDFLRRQPLPIQEGFGIADRIGVGLRRLWIGERKTNQDAEGLTAVHRAKIDRICDGGGNAARQRHALRNSENRRIGSGAGSGLCRRVALRFNIGLRGGGRRSAQRREQGQATKRFLRLANETRSGSQ